MKKKITNSRKKNKTKNQKGKSGDFPPLPVKNDPRLRKHWIVTLGNSSAALLRGWEKGRG